MLGDLMGELNETFGSTSPKKTPSSSGITKYSHNTYSPSTTEISRKNQEQPSSKSTPNGSSFAKYSHNTYSNSSNDVSRKIQEPRHRVETQ